MTRPRFRRRFSISTQVIFFFIIVVLVQGILTQIGMYMLIYRSNIDSYEDQLKAKMAGITAYITQSQEDLENMVSLLAGQKNIIEYTDYRLNNLLSRELSLFNQALGLSGIFVYSESGQLLSTDDVSSVSTDSELYKRITDAYTQGSQSFLYSDTDAVFIWSLGQIVREDQVIGMLGARIRMDEQYIQRLENSINAAVLIDLPNRVIHSDLLNEVQRGHLAEQTSPMRSGETQLFDDHLVGILPIPGIEITNGRLIGILDMRKARTSLLAYNRFSISLTFIVLVGALIISILFYRIVFLRPFNLLHEGVTRIGRGDFTYPIQRESRDEFGDLAESVNRMRINLLNRDEELRKLATYNELILNNVRSGIITAGHDGMINSCNAVARSMVHLVGQSELPLFLDEAGFPSQVRDLIWRGIRERSYVNLQECRITYEGREEILSVSTSPLSDGNDETIGIIAVISDVTRVRLLEEQLQISRRLAAIGEMVAGVSHQLRNPLGIMKVSAEILRDNFSMGIRGDDKQYRQLTGMLVSEIDGLSYIIQNFLDFARPIQIHPTPCEISEIVDEGLSLIPFDQFPSICFDVHVEQNLSRRNLDRNLIEQVIRNLIQNALEATAEGNVSLKVSGCEAGVRIEVRDTGRGMDEETVKNIFNPFYSLKDGGTGLGLSIVHRIVQEHGGNVKVESIPNKGSVFTVVV
jgi:nitrogen fixation/metabolism regulation signal transduction histidine kinase